MATKTAKKKLTNNQKIEQITDKLIAQMESGKLNWNKEWKCMGMPCNYQTKRPYKGMNLVYTMFSEFASNYYLTFNQVKKMGGNVIKGSKGTTIMFWSKFIKEDKETKKQRMLFFAKTFTVFNEEQIEGIEFESDEQMNEFGTVEAIENLVSGMPNPPEMVTVMQDQAFYTPSRDRVTMPEKGQFNSLEAYYSTLIHELVHSTGHKSRLDREGVNSPSMFGSHEYSFEELVAELGAAFIMGMTGVSNENTEKNSAAYLQGWIKKFKSDKQMLYKAASQAQKAVDYMLGSEVE